MRFEQSCDRNWLLCGLRAHKGEKPEMARWGGGSIIIQVRGEEAGKAGGEGSKVSVWFDLDLSGKAMGRPLSR